MSKRLFNLLQVLCVKLLIIEWIGHSYYFIIVVLKTGDTAGSFGTLQLQGPRVDPELGLPIFFPPAKNMQFNDLDKLIKCVCAWFTVIDLCSIQGVFLSHLLWC